MGIGEIVFIVLLALIVVGPKRMPELMRTVGKFVQEAKRASLSLQSGVHEELSKLEGEIGLGAAAKACASPTQFSIAGQIGSFLFEEHQSQDDFILKGAREAVATERQLLAPPQAQPSPTLAAVPDSATEQAHSPIAAPEPRAIPGGSQ